MCVVYLTSRMQMFYVPLIFVCMFSVMLFMEGLFRLDRDMFSKCFDVLLACTLRGLCLTEYFNVLLACTHRGVRF